MIDTEKTILALTIENPRLVDLLKEIYDAIRALILAVEGWKKLAGKHENLVNLKAVRRFLCDIRDFGEEKK